MRRRHDMPFGAQPKDDGTTRFRLWAPAVPSVGLLVEDASGVTRHAMTALPDGWHELLAIRHERLVPRLAGMRRGRTHAVAGDVLRVTWTLGEGSRLHLAVDFGDSPVRADQAPRGGFVYRQGVQTEGAGQRLSPCAMAVSLEAP